MADNGQETLFAATMPQDPFLAKALTMALDKPVRIALGLETDINKALQLYLQEQQEEGTDALGDDQFGGQSDDEFIEHLKDLPG